MIGVCDECLRRIYWRHEEAHTPYLCKGCNDSLRDAQNHLAEMTKYAEDLEKHVEAMWDCGCTEFRIPPKRPKWMEVEE